MFFEGLPFLINVTYLGVTPWSDTLKPTVLYLHLFILYTDCLRKTGTQMGSSFHSSSFL